MRKKKKHKKHKGEITSKSVFLGWNLFFSSSESMDKIAKKEGYAYLGCGKDWSGTEQRVYRMWKISDRRKELRREEKRKERRGEE